jgi:hypothetical protein
VYPKQIKFGGGPAPRSLMWGRLETKSIIEFFVLLGLTSTAAVMVTVAATVMAAACQQFSILANPRPLRTGIHCKYPVTGIPHSDLYI